MNTDIQELILILSQEVEEAGRPSSPDLVESLMFHLDPVDCMQIALSYVQDYYPRFHERYPTITWPSEYLEQLERIVESRQLEWHGPVSVRDRVHPSDDYETPGAGNFIEAVLDLVRMVKTVIDRKLAFWAVSAIARIFMANKESLVEEKYPGVWHVERISDTPGRFGEICRADPEIRELGKRQWRGLLDKCRDLN